MLSSVTIISLAAAGFRRLYGDNANIEDMPEEWRECIREVRQQIEKARHE